MKLCSQCQFIYEDEQERCDMDGAELVYEPTLEHAFPNSALQTRTELERTRPARFVIPLSRSSQPPQTSIAPPPSNRGRLAWQIGAGFILAIASFAAFYATPHLFQDRSTAPNSALQNPKDESTSSSTAVSATSATADKAQTQNAAAEPSPLPEQREAVSAADKPQTTTSTRGSEVRALPEVKPLPRLKPLPTLKPIPKLSDKNRSVNANRQTIIVNTNTKKESRFGSFLKKTGRILTKPFKS